MSAGEGGVLKNEGLAEWVGGVRNSDSNGGERGSEEGSGADSDGTARHGRSVSLSAAHYSARRVLNRRAAPAAGGGGSGARTHVRTFTLPSVWRSSLPDSGMVGVTQEEAACRFFPVAIGGTALKYIPTGPTKHVFP